jgi:hypothetical protein
MVCAYNIVTCGQGGPALKWPSGQRANMVVNLHSMPEGSFQLQAYFNALNQWNSIRGMWDKYVNFGTWPPDQDTIDLGDDWSDVALVDAGSIDGALGSTFVTRDCPDIEVIDVLIANWDTQAFFNPDEAFGDGIDPIAPMNTGWMTILHEFGHGLGLAVTPKGGSDNHVTNALSVMQPSVLPRTGASNGASHARPMPDDAAGGRFLYSSGNSETNLAASAQMLNASQSVVNTAPWGTVNLCRGESLTFNFTILNTGTSALTSDQHFFLGTTPTSHKNPAISLGTWSGATVNAQKRVSPSVTFSIPCGAAPGLYWLFHRTDAAAAFSERSELDNYVHNPRTVRIMQCGCS